ncbi:hypothetical protein QQ045_018745 [Rhodiola kirilowii]
MTLAGLRSSVEQSATKDDRHMYIKVNMISKKITYSYLNLTTPEQGQSSRSASLLQNKANPPDLPRAGTQKQFLNPNFTRTSSHRDRLAFVSINPTIEAREDLMMSLKARIAREEPNALQFHPMIVMAVDRAAPYPS